MLDFTWTSERRAGGGEEAGILVSSVADVETKNQRMCYLFDAQEYLYKREFYQMFDTSDWL